MEIKQLYINIIVFIREDLSYLSYVLCAPTPVQSDLDRSCHVSFLTYDFPTGNTNLQTSGS